MKVETIILRKVQLKLKAPFETSFTRWLHKNFIVVEVHTKDHVGYGECAVLDAPFYNEETIETAWHILEDFLIPMVFEYENINHPSEISQIFSKIRRNNSAKAGIECAFWDLYAKQQGITLSEALGGTRDKVATGVSIGVQESIDELVKLVDGYIEEGYQRIKVKIKPGKDVEYMKALREKYRDIPLMADANSAYSLNDIEIFKELDQLNLTMIEQPLSHDDIIHHAKLQGQLDTPICLDESIHSAEDALKAIELGSTKTINIKVGRVGGLNEAKKIHDICAEHDIPVWCGGMLDGGIARAHNVAIASLPNFKHPGDIPGSSRYYHQDIIYPEVRMSKDGTVEVPQKPGIGFDADEELLEKYTYYKQEFSRGLVTK